MNNSVDKQYLKFLKHILDKGTVKSDRTGTGTISVFDYSMRFNMDEGFPLLTSKKMFTKAVIVELIWFLNGDTNIKYLVDNGCNIWNGDCYKNYLKHFEPEKFPNYVDVNPQSLLPLSMEDFIDEIKTDDEFAKKWGELGPIYGKQWRRWESIDKEAFFNSDNDMDPHVHHGMFYKPKEVDQIQDLIDMLKTTPDSRRLMVNAWNPADLEDMVLPPCHYGFQCYTTVMTFEERVERWVKSIGKDISYSKNITSENLDEMNFPKRKLDLKWNQRSVDSFLGLPFNIASYGFLLHLLAREVNMIPHELIFSGGDCHIYLNHIDVVKKQLGNNTYNLPELILTNTSLFDVKYEDFKIIGYESSESLKGILSN